MTQNAAPIFPPPARGRQDASLPPWYPAWARNLADLYFSGTTCLFVLNGNVHDLVHSPSENGEAYVNLPEFLAAQVFGSWDVILDYDLGRGLRPLAGSDAGRLKSMVRYVTGRLGEPASWPRDPENVLLLLDKFIERSLLEEEAARRKNIAIILEYAQYLVPAGDLGALARAQGTNLVRMLGWAQNPQINLVYIAIFPIPPKIT